jgi:hypothetical protein
MIILCFILSCGLFQSVAGANDSQVSGELDAHRTALDRFYLEIRKLKSPTNAQYEDLKTKILLPADAALQKSIADNADEQLEKTAQSEAQSRREGLRKQAALLDSLGKTAAEKAELKKLLSTQLTDAERGQSNAKNGGNAFAKSGSSADFSVGDPAAVNANDSIGKAIDGSSFAREIEFSGKPKNLTSPSRGALRNPALRKAFPWLTK